MTEGPAPEVKSTAVQATQKRSPFYETIETLVVALVMALFIRAFFFSVFFIPSGSMIPTLLIKDRLIVNKMIFGLPNPLQEATFSQKMFFFIPNPLYRNKSAVCRPKYLFRFGRTPKRLEVIVFKAPLDIVGGNTHTYHDKKRGTITTTYFFPPSKPGSDYIKRLIGLPGEVVMVRKGIVYINGKKLEGTYLLNRDQANFGPVQVPEKCYFMMGDNRAQSSDGRVWGFVPEDNIVGKAEVLIWPLNRIGFIK